MKNSIAAAQVVLAILITGSVAFAMEPAPQPHTESSIVAQVQETAPEPSNEAPQPVPVPETPVAPPQAETPPVEPPAPSVVLTGTPQEWMLQAGISQEYWRAALYITDHESGSCPFKWQGEVGACPAYHGSPTDASVGYGLCQSTPGWKMASAGADWGTNPVTQMKWCNQYAQARYGGWAGAYQRWLEHSNW